MELKRYCPGCHLLLAEDAFHRRKNGKFVSRCKKCRKTERERNYANENASKRLLRANNLKKHRARDKKYAAEHREKNRVRCRAWRKANPEKQQAACQRWRAANRGRIIHANAERRCKVAKAEGTFTLIEWEETCAEYNHRCAYCSKKKKLTRHHVVPISKNGSNRRSNIVPACSSCNSKIGVNITPPTRGGVKWP